ETPPEERHPVLTFVGAYDQGTVTNAIRREMLREGQTFFVHNRADSIHRGPSFGGPSDRGTATHAIRREMLREGQTFFVHNRVDSIDRVAYEVRHAVPEARVAVAHGQMSEDQLE